MNLLFNEMPEELKKILYKSSFKENNTGCTNSIVLYINKVDKYNSAYLKISNYNKNENLESEVKIMKWLKNKIPVPEVYFYTKYNDKEYLLMSEVKGNDCSSEYFFSNPHKMIEIYAKGLKNIHNLNITNCPFSQNIDEKLNKATQNVEKNLVDEDDFQPENKGKKAEEILESLIKKKPQKEEFVFTHGDYCLQNVMIHENKLSGFIDLGRAGVADKYQDIALAYRTLKNNFGNEKWFEIFKRYYGLDYVDYSKIEYYILMDELF